MDDDQHHESDAAMTMETRNDKHDDNVLLQSKPSYDDDQHSSSSLHLSDAPDATHLESEAYSPDERAMRKHLNDVESSFLPDSAPSKASTSFVGKDDTYLNLNTTSDESPSASPSFSKADFETVPDPSQQEMDIHDEEAHHDEHDQDVGLNAEHSSSGAADGGHLESPSAAAAHRNNMRSHGPSSLRRELSARAIANSIPSRTSSHASSPIKSRSHHQSATSTSDRHDYQNTMDALDVPGIITTAATPQSETGRLVRPQHGHARQFSHASSGGYSDLSGGSEATINADYALQTGRAAPNDSPLSSRFVRDLSRLPSFGSVASDLSRDGDRFGPSTRVDLNRAARIDEEDGHNESPYTPRAPTSHAAAGVTDTVIAQHVQNIRVPDTIAQDFRQRFRSISPDKRSVSNSTASRPQSTLTLKEQNSKIDKLTKENFDLKLKIHFLDQALQNRSDEGIKDMINANVSFQTDLAKERRDNQSLRRRIRDLEKQLAELEERLAEADEAHQDARLNSHEELEIEISELREQLDHAQVRITKLSAENLAKEMEKRKMGEYMSSMQERRKSAVGEDEVDMWRDLLTEEQGRREMAEDESRQLREELAKLKAEHTRKQREEDRAATARSRSIASGLTDDARPTTSNSSTTLIEHLRHENNELRRDLGAQSSMLTSRNKERERLQQEIEDLKMMHRKGGDTRSLAGDSILERSASRAARAPSRGSNLTGASRLDDAERDEYERREGLLRDENAQLRLEFQDLEKEAEARMDYIAQLEEDVRTAEADLSAAVEDLRALQKERDDALSAFEEREAEFERLSEDYRRLEEEAVLNIEGLEENLAQYQTNRDKVSGELHRRNEDFVALQSELRTLANKLLQFEDDREASIRRIEVLEQELDDATQELETFERKLSESEQKNSRLEVQSESLQNEISFLREEQEADKVKIGDLSNALHAAQQAVQDERERMQELESSLLEERRQRVLIDDQSKQEVQKVIADLNSDNARSRDELRKLRRNLSGKENEVETYRTRLEDLENNLRRALGDPTGGRSSLLQDVEKLQHDLLRATQDLEAATADVADKERLIKSRDVLLESSSLEARRLSDLLDKERQGRKHDLHNFELAQRGNSTNLRAIATRESRSADLETQLSQAKRRAAQAESNYKEHLAERNALLLSLWNRLSTLCGADWAQQNGTLNGSVTNVDNITRFFTQFQRNVLAATKHIESLFSGLRTRIKTAEKQMTKDVSGLTSTLDARMKRLEQLEKSVGEVTQVNAQLRSAIANSGISTSSGRSPSAMSMSGGTTNKLTKIHQEEINYLKQEIKSLKSELKIHRSYPSAEAAERISAEPSPNHSRRSSVLGLVLGDLARSNSRDGNTHDGSSSSSRRSPGNLANKFLRHSSENAVRTVSLAAHRGSTDFSAMQAPPEQAFTEASATHTSATEQRWLHRVQELERRLKAEREARLLDRRGARERLDARHNENEELRAELAREKIRSSAASSAAPSASTSPDLGGEPERWHSFDAAAEGPVPAPPAAAAAAVTPPEDEAAKLRASLDATPRASPRKLRTADGHLAEKKSDRSGQTRG